MGTTSFQQGVKFNFENKCFTLMRKVSADLWQLEDNKTKRIYEYTDAQLRKFYVDGSLTFINTKAIPFNSHSKQDYLDIPNTRCKLNSAIYNTWIKLGTLGVKPNPATVIRWKNKFIASGRDIISLVERSDIKGNRAGRYPKEVYEIVDKAIKKKYLTNERMTIKDALDYAEFLVRKENELRPFDIQLSIPKRRFIKSRIDSIPAFDRYVARHGRMEAITKFRSVLGHRITQAPLERAEIDHTPLDLIVIDDETALPLGRPWVTACIDDYTRCILGIHISFEPPSYQTVACCLKKSFCPKVDLHNEFSSIKNTWDAHGVFRELVVDNGLEFHSISLEKACFTLGIEIHYAPRKTGWFKAKIERFFRTFNGGVAHGNPGTTFSNILQKGDYDPSKQAVIRMNVLQELAIKWVVDYYHQKPHRALNASPAVVWKSSINPEDIMLPDNLAQLDAILGRSYTRSLNHQGILLNYLFYNSAELSSYRRQHGDKFMVEIRVNEADLGYINVLSVDKTQIFKVPALFFEYANGLSCWQHRIIKKYAERELSKLDPMAWLQAKEDIANFVEDEIMIKRGKTRSKIARFKGQKTSNKQVEIEEENIQKVDVIKETPIVDNQDSYKFTDRNETSKKKFKPEYRERSVNLIKDDQSESDDNPSNE